MINIQNGAQSDNESYIVRQEKDKSVTPSRSGGRSVNKSIISNEVGAAMETSLEKYLNK